MEYNTLLMMDVSSEESLPIGTSDIEIEGRIGLDCISLQSGLD